jgi:hypothetical protein
VAGLELGDVGLVDVDTDDRALFAEFGRERQADPTAERG